MKLKPEKVTSIRATAFCEDCDIEMSLESVRYDEEKGMIRKYVCPKCGKSEDSPYIFPSVMYVGESGKVYDSEMEEVEE